MTVLIGIILAEFFIPNAFGDKFDLQTDLTTNNSLLVTLYTIPKNPNSGEEIKLKISFLKPDTGNIQEHIDYRITIEKRAEILFETSLTHTSTGSVTVPFKFDENGSYDVYVEVEGILFSPIPIEKAIFSVQVGQELTGHDFEPSKEISIPIWVKNNAGWWAQDQIGDSDFISGIQYLISNGIMIIPQTQSGQSSGKDIPDWIKNNAEWWSQDKIGDSDFISGIQYLIQNGIMSV